MFEVKRGSSRIALIGEEHVAKVPRMPTIRELKTLKNGYYWLKKGRPDMFKIWLNMSEDSNVGPRSFLTRGYMQNVREASLSSKLGELAVPTRLSIAGLLNIQDFSADLSLDEKQLVAVLQKTLPMDLHVDTHSFYNPQNYGWHEGTVKLRDYGGESISEMLMDHRREFADVLGALREADCVNTEASLQEAV